MEGVMMDEGSVVGKERSGVVMEELEAKKQKGLVGCLGEATEKIVVEESTPNSIAGLSE
jgi:hypothetical protein